MRFFAVALALACVLALSACSAKEPQPSTYFERTVAPILQSSCVRTNTGASCHVADGRGNAFGNLDLATFGGLDRRRDLLLDYGPYLQPSMLVKNVAPYALTVELWDGTKVPITTDVRHTGGPILDPTSSDYGTLRRYIENGATENNTGVPPVAIARTPCTHVVPASEGFDPTADPAAADFQLFQTVAGPLLRSSCSAGNCHGTEVNALYLTCGQTPEEVRWNYFAAVDYLSATAEASEIVRRPLASSQGGSYHEGGPLFSSVNDPGYTALVQWASKHGPAAAFGTDAGFDFFAKRVQPVLVKKGCMMAQCHSAAMFHDYRLRGGSAGSFSLHATRRNYEFSVAQMSFESDDVNASRLVRKNLYRADLAPGSAGIAHRGGALFEDFGGATAGGGAKAGITASGLASGALCDAAHYDFDAGALDAIPAYCVVREWHKRERTERALAPLSAIAYVKRPPPGGPDRPQDFDVFSGGASLHIAQVALPISGGAPTIGADAAVDLATCGLGPGPDVRRPSVSWDGKTIAFAGRSTASDPLAVYTIATDGTGCAKQPDIAMHVPSANGLLEHDFDPAFSPPGPDGVERIVFASTRGNLDDSAFDYSGPQRTPEDPTKPNANLYVLEPGAAGAGLRVRQLTFALNMERLPSFMQDGRLIYTAEKREPGFYQLALRRQNLDGGDSHPLFAQRASVGATQATFGVELSDKNFAAVLSGASAAHGAGELAIFNRSIGVDFASPNPSDYLIDPTVIDKASPASPEASFFLHSVRVAGNDGSYTSPSALPNGAMLVSFEGTDPTQSTGQYDVYFLDPATGQKTKLLGDPSAAEVEAVGVFARAPKGLFASAQDEPNGHTRVDPSQTSADVTVLDTGVLASLLFQNTPTGRAIESDLKSYEVYEELPPDPGVTGFPTSCGGFTACDAYGMVYVRRRLLGVVPIASDGSSHFRIPGGLPILLHLGDDSVSTANHLPRWQRETMTFLPGEVANQAMPRAFFNDLCAGCHGSISGRPVDAALRPDFLTGASNVVAQGPAQSVDLTGPPPRRGSVRAPPFAP